ncbi:hypothetical protein BC828DRAFT_409144, partial [Blastocladiella britannica]
MTNTIFAGSVPVSRVTVHRDRAEVSRLLDNIVVPKRGSAEVVLRGLPRVADLNSVRVETATPGTKVVIADVQATLKYEKVLDGDRAGESGHDGDGDDDAEKTTILDDDDDETKQRKRQYARTLAENRTTRDCVS